MGKALILPSVGEILIKLILLYVLLVMVAAAFTFLFKLDPPSRISTIAFWIALLALAAWVFS